MPTICKSRLAGAITSLLGIAFAIGILAFSRGFALENLRKLMSDFISTPGAIIAACVLILNGLWMGPVLFKRYSRSRIRAIFSGMIAAWLSIALAVCTGYLAHVVHENQFDEWWIGMAVYALYSLILGGIPAGILGGSLGLFLRNLKRK